MKAIELVQIVKEANALMTNPSRVAEAIELLASVPGARPTDAPAVFRTPEGIRFGVDAWWDEADCRAFVLDGAEFLLKENSNLGLANGVRGGWIRREADGFYWSVSP